MIRNRHEWLFGFVIMVNDIEIESMNSIEHNHYFMHMKSAEIPLVNMKVVVPV